MDEMFSTDTHGDNEDEKEKGPGYILIPTEGQENAEVISDGSGPPVEYPEPTEGHLSTEAIRNRRNIEDNMY